MSHAPNRTSRLRGAPPSSAGLHLSFAALPAAVALAVFGAIPGLGAKAPTIASTSAASHPVAAHHPHGPATTVEARWTRTPPTDRRSSHYVSNRPPLCPSPLVPLPIRAIAPRGWLRRQLELQADGLHGRLGEVSRFLKKEDNSWLAPEGLGKHGWEEVPYWLKGYVHCAALLNRADLLREASVWIEGALASQRPDGWFGPVKAKPTLKSTEGEHDLWPNMVMLCCLQSHHERTGDPRVLDLMRRYFRWQLAYPEERFLPPHWQQQRAADNLWSVYWLYNRIGEDWLLELAHKIHRRTADWTSGLQSPHNVNIAQAFDGPAIYWQQSGDPRHLLAAERNWRAVRDTYGQVPGGMFGADEQCRPGHTGPRQAVETCGIVEEMLSDEQLLQVTGDASWADRAEEVAFNSFPATMTPDIRALRYLTAPNQPLSDSASKAPGIRNAGPMFLMSANRYRCCQHNFGHGWPYFASSLWFATGDDGLAAAFYCESEVAARVGAEGRQIRLREHTRYPFDERVCLALSTDAAVRFTLYLRLPAWCRVPRITVNGKAVSIGIRETPPQAEATGYVALTATWNDGDTIELELPMTLEIRRWEKNRGYASVHRGPLAYSLRIAEDYRRAGGSDAWPHWELWPASPWNYGLAYGADGSAPRIEVVRRPWPDDDQPFSQAGTPLLLRTKGRRIPEWKLDPRGLIEEIERNPVASDQPVEDIELVPLGAARLRISAFPVTMDKARL